MLIDSDSVLLRAKVKSANKLNTVDLTQTVLVRAVLQKRSAIFVAATLWLTNMIKLVIIMYTSLGRAPWPNG